MELLIDAINIRAGGGVTHLYELLNNKCFGLIKFDKVVIVTQIDVFDTLPSSNFEIIKVRLSLVEKTQHVIAPVSVLRKKYDLVNVGLVFSPGGTFFSRKVKYVSMSQNMLIFESIERNRFPLSLARFRYNFLEVLQRRSLANSIGNIFISNYAKHFITEKYRQIGEISSDIIYHGVSHRFRSEPKQQRAIGEYSKVNPFRILYISIVNFYKHQDTLIQAVKSLREKGMPIHLDLVGPVNAAIKPYFYTCLEGCEDYITYHGKVPYGDVHNFYKAADLFVFASTCENMPNILIEAMSAGLPILCSRYGPMPEILEDAGIYCDPTMPDNIASQLKMLIENRELRQTLAHKVYDRSLQYTWDKCAQQTVRFLESIVQRREKIYETTDTVI